MLLCTVAAAHADNSRTAQRLGAALLVIKGDVRFLEDSQTLSLHKQGLRSRIKGSLSVLPLLLRENGNKQTENVSLLREAVRDDDWTGFIKTLDKLIARHPLDLFALRTAQPTPNRLKRGQAIHEEACAGCHDTPDLDTPLPARNLFEQTKMMTRGEFTARLINGVRGDRVTSLANPLSVEDIASLVVYYRLDQ